VVDAGWNAQCGLLVNSSRGILYASSESDFAEKARESAKALRDEMSAILQERT
jgi:orotidine-5'-phosphate decarboxylase